jgi:hypothetical protein
VKRLANPQAMAAVSKRVVFGGLALLSETVDADTWLTPRYILDQLGSFDLDPCAAERVPDWTKAKKTLTKAMNGLVTPWRGRVFMNPPFSDTSRWLERHASHGEGISLVPATVESKVWREKVWRLASAIFLLHGRTRFCNPDGSTTTGRPLRSIALIGWSEADAAILRNVTFAGVLLEAWEQR